MRETRSQLSVFEVVPGTDQVRPCVPLGSSLGPCPYLIFRVEVGYIRGACSSVSLVHSGT